MLREGLRVLGVDDAGEGRPVVLLVQVPAMCPGQLGNERQIKVLNRMLDGFKGKLPSFTWAKLTKCSQDTAGRDIAALIERGILRRGEAGGWSTSYEFVPP